MPKIDFSDCKKCPIRKECREYEIKDLTCEELYEVLKAGEENMTNSDKIRQMTDEQLAEFLASLMPSSCDYCKAEEDAFFSCHLDCKRGWETWLKDTQNILEEER